ncbi:hypothetical protein N3K66_002016 [Trichothecium roseum]|uniref:Uncharacterized protein n=1 Tax=Trichothecium roseum TaxID=47278 RepID=A0ACC0V8F3_9HYPO|nr:hypothetical protein N3K66_002016 [Trichothecium roseum]
MQRVSAFLPSWEKRSSSFGSKVGGGGFFGWGAGNRSSTSTTASVSNALAKVNVAAANAGQPGRVQKEAFWPATLDLECEKAARIIKSFCADGYLAPVDNEGEISDGPSSDEPITPAKVPKKIPKRILQNAAGIAVFTCMRSGLWMTGSGGSGILIARKSDGTWSPPSGIMLHTPSLSFIIGVDIYDCVLVVNDLAALESITRPRVCLGEDVDLMQGPLVPLESPDFEANLKELGNSVMTYMKARGQEQNVNLNGSILTERANENERFYQSSVTQMDVLSGSVDRQVQETQALFEVIKMAEGRTDFDASLISKIAVEVAPGDAMIASPRSAKSAKSATSSVQFGLPSVADPDPFGILALEMAGMEIREAGTKLRPASSQIDFHSRPASGASRLNRESGASFMTRSGRESYMSSRTVKSQMTDAGTQTNVTPGTSPSPGQSDDGDVRTSFDTKPERVEEEEEEIDYTTVDLTPIKHLSHPSNIVEELSDDESKDLAVSQLRVPAKDDDDRASRTSSLYDEGASRNDSDSSNSDDDEEYEEPVVYEVAAVQPARTQAVASRMIQAKGAVVTIPKRVPPPLPSRNPARASRASKSEIGDVSDLYSPQRSSFNGSDVNITEEGLHSIVNTDRLSIASAYHSRSNSLQQEGSHSRTNSLQGSSRPASFHSGESKLLANEHLSIVSPKHSRSNSLNGETSRPASIKSQESKDLDIEKVESKPEEERDEKIEVKDSEKTEISQPAETSQTSSPEIRVSMDDSAS